MNFLKYSMIPALLISASAGARPKATSQPLASASPGMCSILVIRDPSGLRIGDLSALSRKPEAVPLLMRNLKFPLTAKAAPLPDQILYFGLTLAIVAHLEPKTCWQMPLGEKELSGPCDDIKALADLLNDNVYDSKEDRPMDLGDACLRILNPKP